MNKRKSIVDAHGNPVAAEEGVVQDLNLPPGVQALVETRINDAIDRLRELNQADLNALSRDHAKKWRILTLISWVITAVFAIWAPIQIPGWIQQYVQTHMTKPEMERIADDAIRTKMGAYVDEKLSRVERSTDKAMSDVSILTNQVATVSQDLAGAQSDFDDMAGNILALRQFFNARIGDREGYNGLIASAQNTNDTLAVALLQDIQGLYRDFKNDTLGKPVGQWGREIAHIKTKQYYKSAAENIRDLLIHKDPFQRQAEVNETARRGFKFYVEDLVSVVTNDPNIFVASRAVSSIESLSGKTFGDLPPFSDVVEWWQSEGQTNVDYASPFKLLDEANSKLQEGHLDGALVLYQQAVSNWPSLAKSFYIIGVIQKEKGDVESAQLAFKSATEAADGFWLAAFEYADILARQGKYNEAIEELKKVKPYFVGDFVSTVKDRPSYQILYGVPSFKSLCEAEK